MEYHHLIPGALHSKVLSLCHDHPSQNILQCIANGIAYQSCIFGRMHTMMLSMGCKVVHPVLLTSLRQRDITRNVGPFLPATPSGNRYALIMVNHLSKWPEVIPLKDIDAPTIARAIHDQLTCRYGLMKRLPPDVHDCPLKDISTLQGIGRSNSSRPHP